MSFVILYSCPFNTQKFVQQRRFSLSIFFSSSKCNKVSDYSEGMSYADLTNLVQTGPSFYLPCFHLPFPYN